MNDVQFTNIPPSRLPSLPFPSFPSDATVTDDVNHFFLDEGGNSQPHLPAHDTPIQLTRNPLRHIARQASIASFSTTSSLPSGSNAVPGIVMDLSLADVCIHIDAHPSLRAAEIVSTECYALRAGAVTHRFVVLELRRQGRKDVWLRLDRRRGEKVSIFRFLSASGITDANDRAMLSADKNSLIRGAKQENRQEFEISPVLGEFTRLLRIIQEEIVTYRIWPENCWFFCSLIQQHLEGGETESFKIGNLKHPNLANDIRVRIYRRLLARRPPPTDLLQTREIQTSTPLVPAPLPSPPPSSHSSPSILPPSVSPPPAPSPSPSIDLDVRVESPTAKVIEALGQLVQNESLEEKVRNNAVKALKLASDMSEIDGDVMRDQKDICGRLALLLHYLPCNLVGFQTLRAILQGEAIRLQRGITSTKTPLGKQATLGDMFYNLAITLIDDGHPNEACLADEEAILIRRELYRISPSASRSNLARSLHNYSVHLGACKRYEEACVAEAEAVGLRNMLFERNPDEHRKGLAHSLHNYGFNLASVPRFEDARRNLEEAIVLYRQLYQKDPEEHRTFFAGCLAIYAATLDDLGLISEWRLAVEERKALFTEMKPSSSSTSGKLNGVGRVKEAPIVLNEQEALKAERSSVA